jgi:hypothetical protein
VSPIKPIDESKLKGERSFTLTKIKPLKYHHSYRKKRSIDTTYREGLELSSARSAFGINGWGSFSRLATSNVEAKNTTKRSTDNIIDKGQEEIKVIMTPIPVEQPKPKRVIKIKVDGAKHPMVKTLIDKLDVTLEALNFKEAANLTQKDEESDTQPSAMSRV